MKNKKKNKGKGLLLKSELFWDVASRKEQNEAEKLAEEYKGFLDKVRTEKQAIRQCLDMAKKHGFVEADLDKDLPKGKSKLVFLNRGKSAVFVKLEAGRLTKGASFLLAHVDSPRLDLKVRPLYEDGEIAYFKPHYYGEIKKYHWPTTPLGLHGTVILKDGKEIEINIGSEEKDPVFLISDLLPHLDYERLEKPLGKAIEAEELNVIVGSKPIKDKEAKNRVKMAVLEYLKKNYKIGEEELVTADLRFVPAFKARDVGFDRGLVASYGQDDRVCVFTAVKAFLAANNLVTNILYLADKEEIGSLGATGAQSLFLENVLDCLMATVGRKYSLYDFYRHSKAISADTTGAYDPDYKNAYDMNNLIKMGYGLAIEKHIGHRGKALTMEAEPAFLREVINLFNKKKVLWQTGHLSKMDQGGGGSIAVYLSNRNMEVVDAGVPLLNLHSPYELASKGDIYSAYKAYKVFLEN